jgi:hypothetical protein
MVKSQNMHPETLSVKAPGPALRTPRVIGDHGPTIHHPRTRGSWDAETCADISTTVHCLFITPTKCGTHTDSLTAHRTDCTAIHTTEV